MQTMIGSDRILYAAIEARRGGGAIERFVIAYTWEQSLRELLAAPSIVATGCLTREHAEEICREEKPGRDRSQQQMRQVFALNAAPRLALHDGVCSAIRSVWVMLPIFVVRCLQKVCLMPARPLEGVQFAALKTSAPVCR
jgi:hypothetical protein